MFLFLSFPFRFVLFHLKRIIIVFGCNNVGTPLSISIHFQAIALCFHKRMRISPHIHTYCEKGRLDGEENERTKERARRRKGIGDGERKFELVLIYRVIRFQANQKHKKGVNVKYIHALSVITGW